MEQKKMTASEISNSLIEYHLVHRNLFKNLVKSSTMPITQYHILEMLSRSRNMRMGEISQLMAISRPNLTPLIDKLVSLRYVDRVADSHDRRVTYINITDDGRDALATEHKSIESNVETFCERLAPSDYKNFCSAITTLVNLSNKL